MEEERFELLIPGLRLWVSLGCGPEEKVRPQPVDVNLRMVFPQELRGCQSDRLEDVVCYKTVAEAVVESVRGRPFDLIEFLASSIFRTVEPFVPKGSLLEVVVAKPNHPVPHVLKAITFKYSKRVS